MNRIVIGVIFGIVMAVGILLINYAHGQEWNTTEQTEQNSTNAVLMKHKGEFYCYDSDTTTKKEVLEEKERNSIDETIYQNAILSNLAEDDRELAEKVCQGMVDDGQFPRDNQGEEIELEGTLTLEFE